ncbi:amino acid permease [Lentibacillus saliphilus]|uniref:amino acid permease n=1 Tax=Lentibacillus saliphilus TaxID=2737028 RepID=UPI001C2F8D3A|nr:amino acid permease [Lentibacillus saliphilus]
MKHHPLLKQSVHHKQKQNGAAHITWWQLSLIGIGSIIGAGFFLGTGLSIKIAGPSILVGYMVAGVTALFVFSALAEMTVNDPQTGSFRTYAGKAYGHWLGFTSGWLYWLSGILIMSSEIIALSTFTQFWFETIPLWVFSIIYALLGIGINVLGVKDFGKIESLFAVVKLSTLVAFIVFGGLFLFGVITPKEVVNSAHVTAHNLFPNGVMGLWSALIFIFFSFGGIAVVGVASSELKNKNDIPKAGFSLILVLVSVYLLSIFFVLEMADWTLINENESPFVTALSAFHIPFLDSLFNVIIISAAFSTMVGAFFSVSHVMLSLSEGGDAPKGLQEKNSRGVALKSLLLTSAVLGLSIVLSFLLPDTVYEYVTTAAGIMLILNWSIILASHIKLHPTYANHPDSFKAFGYPFTSYLGIGFIVLAISGALFHSNERVGLLISGALIATILLCYQFFFGFKKPK